MKRHSGSGRLGKRGTTRTEDINPMESVANLADVMLVFACGLMLALITYWNVDVGGIAGSAVEIQQGMEITDFEGLDEDTGQPLDQDSQLEEYGKVYRDANGNFYMVATE